MAVITQKLEDPELTELLTNLVKCIAETMPEIAAPYAQTWSTNLISRIGTSTDTVFNLSQVLKYITDSRNSCEILVTHKLEMFVVQAACSLLTAEETGDAQKGATILLQLIKNCQQHLEPFK